MEKSLNVILEEEKEQGDVDDKAVAIGLLASGDHVYILHKDDEETEVARERVKSDFGSKVTEWIDFEPKNPGFKRKEEEVEPPVVEEDIKVKGDPFNQTEAEKENKERDKFTEVKVDPDQVEEQEELKDLKIDVINAQNDASSNIASHDKAIKQFYERRGKKDGKADGDGDSSSKSGDKGSEKESKDNENTDKSDNKDKKEGDSVSSAGKDNETKSDDSKTDDSGKS